MKYMLCCIKYTKYNNKMKYTYLINHTNTNTIKLISVFNATTYLTASLVGIPRASCSLENDSSI